MTPAQVARADDLGSRTYATLSGSIAADYVETFTDDNDNGTQDAGEDGVSWYYFLVDPRRDPAWSSGAGRHPRSSSGSRPPASSSRMPEYVKEDLSFFADQATSLTFTLDPTRYLDTTAPIDTATPVRDLADGIPAADTPIRISGSTAGYLPVCSGDANGDGVCQDDEVDLWDVAVFDPVSGQGITVLVDENPRVHAGQFHRDAAP